MDDTKYGTRDKSGHWKPFNPIAYPPVFVWPAKPKGVLRWLFGYPGYLLPDNLFYALVATLVWRYFTPPLEAMKSFEPGWIAYLLARNVMIALLFYGSFHLWLHVRKAQGTRFKYHPKWLGTDNPAFLFRNQTIDNMIWSIGSGLTMWTAFEALTLWSYANGYLPFVRWEQHPIYGALLMLSIPLIREVHFYLIHRLIHWRPLYRTVHKLHHHNVNPGPWSGLAMHPVEHLLYFSGILIHWIVPSHPVHALFHIMHAGLSPALGHAGFDKIEIGKNSGFDTQCHAHYLHHKYFECNYADGSLPLDRWFGSFHDGSDAAQKAMNKRLLAQAGNRS